MKRILFVILAAIMLAAPAVEAKKISDIRVYINPGHGGYGSDDRPIHIYPFAKNDTASYWESKSNLYKGLHMFHILDSLGGFKAKAILDEAKKNAKHDTIRAKINAMTEFKALEDAGVNARMSRVKNTAEDDRSLTGIGQEATQWEADIFFSIHTNAGESVNYPLMLYREETVGTPRYPENITISEILGNNLYSSKLANWTHPLQICGDLTFYPHWGTSGLGVLRRLYVPGLLSEGGMHEHRPEAYRLMNDDYWWLEAWHFVKTVMDFFETEDRFETGNVAGIVYDDHNLREKDMPVGFSNWGRDKLAPVNGCYIELLDMEGNLVQKRTTDNMYNGVFVFRNVAPGQYKLRTTHNEYYSYESTVEVKACEVTYNDIALSMRREFPLEVKLTQPTDLSQALSCATILEFEFNTDVDVESFEKAFSIEPACEGYFTYSDNLHKAYFTPALSFSRGTNYKVTISTDAKHPDVKYATPNLQEPFVFTFTTKNRDKLEVIDRFPADGGAIHYESPQIELRFDALIDQSTVYDNVKITDSKGNVMSPNKRGSKFNKLSNNYGNAVIALSDDLTEGETYNVSINRELRDKEQLPLGADETYSFKAVNATSNAGEMTVINDFENVTNFAYNAESSKGVSTTLPTCKKYTTNKLFGSASAYFTYAFADSHDGEIVWNYTGETEVLEAGDELKFFVSGDFNNHELYIGVSAGTDTKWLKATTLNFLGWQYINVSLAELDASFSYTLSGFKLVQVQSIITQKGSFCIDNLSKKASAGIGDITVDDINAPSVYYNLQGVEVKNPAKGIYIERRGNQIRKVAVE